MTSTVDRAVLCSHNSPQRCVVFDVACKSRELGNNYNNLCRYSKIRNILVVKQDITNLELSVIPGCLDDPLDKGFGYLVLHWAFVTCVGDAEHSITGSETGTCTFLWYLQELVFCK